MKNYVWYVLGAVFYKNKLLDSKKIVSSKYLIVLSFLFIIFSTIFYALDINFFLINIVMAIIGILITIGLSKKIAKNRFLEYLGKMTLPIYLLHGIVIAFIRIVLNKLKIPMLFGITPLLICTIFGILISIILYNFCKNTFLNFIFYPKKYLTKG